MRILVTIIFITFFIGCASKGAPTFNVTVDSLASADAPGKKTYILLPGNEGVSWDDLQFKEYAVYLMRVLNAQGYVVATSETEADVAIVLSYGIGDPQTREYTYTLPTWGKTGVASSSTSATASTYGNQTTVNANTTYTPSYGITGYRTHTGSETTFFRYALVTGYDYMEFKASKRQVQLWKTTIMSTGSSGDLRRVFPILISAAVPYLASNTGQKVPVSISESDKVVNAVKGQVPEK